MVLHRKGVETEAEEGIIAGSLMPFSEHAVDEMVASRMEEFGARGSFQGLRETGLDGLDYKREFRGDEVGQWFVLKELELTTGKRPGGKW